MQYREEEARCESEHTRECSDAPSRGRRRPGGINRDAHDKEHRRLAGICDS
jgi:hypothetical protein